MADEWDREQVRRESRRQVRPTGVGFSYDPTIEDNYPSTEDEIDDE